MTHYNPMLEKPQQQIQEYNKDTEAKIEEVAFKHDGRLFNREQKLPKHKIDGYKTNTHLNFDCISRTFKMSYCFSLFLKLGIVL